MTCALAEILTNLIFKLDNLHKKQKTYFISCSQQVFGTTLGDIRKSLVAVLITWSDLVHIMFLAPLSGTLVSIW